VDAARAWSRSTALWAALESIAPRIGCVPQTLMVWVARQEVDTGVREEMSMTETQRVKDLEHEVKVLHLVNEIL
jgi:transposase-like protein